MVQRHQQHELLIRQAQQRHPQRKILPQIKGLGGRGRDPLPAGYGTLVVRQVAQILELRDKGLRRTDHLHRRAVLRFEHGPQDFMPPHDLLEAPQQHLLIQPSPQPQRRWEYC